MRHKHLHLSFLLLAILVLPIGGLRAQTDLFTNDGLTITNESGLTITVEGAVTNQNNGKLTNKGVLELTGHWTNTANPDLDSGLVRFNGSSLQQITGDNKFYDLNIDTERRGSIIKRCCQIIVQPSVLYIKCD